MINSLVGIRKKFSRDGNLSSPDKESLDSPELPFVLISRDVDRVTA
jgi:hypothetical protein